jgi:hypothetical protein
MIKKQFTLYLENKPGALAKITKRMAAKNVNIEGISVSESTDVGLVQMVPNNADAARRALATAGVPYTVQDVCLLSLKNKPGALSNVVSKLAAAKVNINYVYATGCTCSNSHCECLAIISAPDLQAVEKAWKSTSKKR